MRTITRFLTLAFLMLVASCGEEPTPAPKPTPTPTPPTPAEVAVSSVSLNQSTAELMIGETVTLSATVSPSNATNKSVSWTSSDANVVSVSAGTVKGIGIGTATVTASAGGKSASCAVTVVKGGLPEGELPPSNEIWYTTQDNKPLSLVNNQGSCTLASNTYSKGMGILRFSGPLTSLDVISSDPQQCARLTGLLIPDCVETIGNHIFWDATGIKEFRIPASLKRVPTS